MATSLPAATSSGMAASFRSLKGVTSDALVEEAEGKRDHNDTDMTFKTVSRTCRRSCD
jgi:hypothetical protein